MEDNQPVSLREHLLALREADQLAVRTALAELTRRLAEMNEFRATVSDQQRTFMPRSEVEARFDAATEKINFGASALATLASEKRGQGNAWGYVVGVIGVVSTLITLAFLILKK